ncbi:Outer membrane lipoprotein blc precursor [Raoultella terrigena]|uniref:Outer membrane lipoprotein blc n=1 Tax=Raoultella terrigena TaxID=577 RepID=A0A4U9DHC7_RAOTE|nr:Outer membrane lipoprotein blc precursor [Raoultella terrigena]
MCSLSPALTPAVIWVNGTKSRRLENRFERGLEQVSATYGKRSDGGLSVLNRGYDPQKNRWNESEGKAYFTGPATTAALKVSFFGPFYGGYNVIKLDEDYQYAPGQRAEPRLSVDPVAYANPSGSSQAGLP